MTMPAALPARHPRTTTGPIVVRPHEIKRGWSLPDGDEDDSCIEIDDADLFDVEPLPPGGMRRGS